MKINWMIGFIFSFQISSAWADCQFEELNKAKEIAKKITLDMTCFGHLDDGNGLINTVQYAMCGGLYFDGTISKIQANSKIAEVRRNINALDLKPSEKKLLGEILDIQVKQSELAELKRNNPKALPSNHVQLEKEYTAKLLEKRSAWSQMPVNASVRQTLGKQILSSSANAGAKLGGTRTLANRFGWIGVYAMLFNFDDYYKLIVGPSASDTLKNNDDILSRLINFDSLSKDEQCNLIAKMDGTSRMKGLADHIVKTLEEMMQKRPVVDSLQCKSNGSRKHLEISLTSKTGSSKDAKKVIRIESNGTVPKDLKYSDDGTMQALDVKVYSSHPEITAPTYMERPDSTFVLYSGRTKQLYGDKAIVRDLSVEKKSNNRCTKEKSLCVPPVTLYDFDAIKAKTLELSKSYLLNERRAGTDLFDVDMIPDLKTHIRQCLPHSDIDGSPDSNDNGKAIDNGKATN